MASRARKEVSELETDMKVLWATASDYLSGAR